MKKKKIIIPVVLAAAVLAGVAAWQGTRPQEVTNYNGMAFEEEQEAPDGEETRQAGTAAGIEIPGYESIVIPAGTKDVSVELLNPESNNVYFQISFRLPETDETIYTSDLLKPGQHIYAITLEKEMEAGEYPLTVQYATYTADEEMAPRNGAEVSCMLIVQ